MLWKTGMNSASTLSFVTSSLTSSLSLILLSISIFIFCFFVCFLVPFHCSLAWPVFITFQIPFESFFFSAILFQTVNNMICPGISQFVDSIAIAGNVSLPRQDQDSAVSCFPNWYWPAMNKVTVNDGFPQNLG